MTAENSPQRQGPGPVLRVTVECRDGEWRVIDRYHAPEMTIPPSEDLAAPAGDRDVIGSWFELVDGHGEVMYRRRMMAPRWGVEISHPDGTMSMVDSRGRPFSNDLLMPDTPKAAQLRLFVEQRLPRSDAKGEQPEPVAVVPAREDPAREDPARADSARDAPTRRDREG